MEKHEQAAVIGWASHIPEIRDDLIAIPNGGYRKPREGASLKRQGVKKGVSDLFLSISRGGYHGLWIELKSKNGKLTTEQQEWLERKIVQGYAAVAAWGADEAINHLKNYLRLDEEGRPCSA